MQKSIIALVTLSITFGMLFYLSGCYKQEEKTVTTTSVHTTVENQLDKEQSTFQKSVDELYTYEAKVTRDFENRERFSISEIFANEGIENYWKRLVRTHARHVDKNWDPVANSVAVQWDLQVEANGFIVLPVYIDYKPMKLLEVNENYEPTEEFTTYDKDVDEKMYFTVKVDPNGRYLIVNINPEQIAETDLKQFAWDYTEENWIKLLEGIQQKIGDDPNMKWAEDYIDGIITPDQMQSHLQEERDNLPKESPTRAVYNRDGAASYAFNKAYNNNTAYKTYDNDCTNFVSQCLKNGGFSFDNTPTNTTSCNCWWYNTNGTSATSNDTESQTWTTANGLKRYLQVCQNHASVISTVNGYYSVGIQKGDVLFMNLWAPNDVYDHALIVYRIAAYTPPGGNVCYYVPTVCAHTSARQDYGLWLSPFGYNVLVSTATIFGHISNTN